tara:strand:+ start:366 stop:2105 length:1740 start_codon:yes stop_codon:yes gene_type:complete
MISEKIINFSKYFILNKNNILADQNLLENFVNNNYFEDLLISLAKVDPYDFKISDEFLKLNAISSLPHLRILKTSLNLTTERFILELSYLVSPFNKNLSTELKVLSSKISNTNFGNAKLISNLLNSSKKLFYEQLILDFEQKNPLALYPTSSYRNSSGHVVSSNDYQQIEATMNLNTFTSIKVEESTLDINNPLLRDNYKSFGRCVCLIDQNIEDNYGVEIENYFNHHSIILEKLVYRAMEVDKHIKNVEKIVEDFRKLGVNRNEPILIIGGGVIGDIGAFAASIYHRSTPYIMLSTSVVSAIDSGPSPRSCCDAGGFKNLLGSFHAPVLNISDRSFFKSLRTSWVRHGIAEIHKMAVIRDKELFHLLEDTGLDLMKTHFGTINCKTQDKIVSKSKKIIGLSLKSYVESEYDNLHEVHSIRDHAFGHGLSANFELKAGLLHGHAISVEMNLSTFMSYKRGWINQKDLHRIFRLFSEYELSLWHDILLDEKCMNEGFDKILQKRGGNLAIPVPTGIGKCKYINDLTKSELKEIIHEYKSVVSKYPRKGLGVEPLCSDAGLEDPVTVFKTDENISKEANLN